MKTNITGMYLATLTAAALLSPSSLYAAPPVDASGGADFGLTSDAFIYNYLPLTLGGGLWTDQNGGLANIGVPVGQFTGFYDDGTELLVTDLIPLRTEKLTIVNDKGDVVFVIEPGNKGPAGSTGPAGTAGPNGSAGTVGPQGAPGPKGAAGAQGSAGPKGETGDRGAIGLKGANGAPGAIGPQGPAGARGPIGAAGAAGARGPVGATGAAGARGAVGATGARGAAGPQGARGAQGAGGIAGTAFAYGTTKMFDVGDRPGTPGLVRRYNCNNTSYGQSHNVTSANVIFATPAPDTNYTVALMIEALNAHYVNQPYIINKSRSGFTIMVREDRDWANPLQIDFTVLMR